MALGLPIGLAVALFCLGLFLLRKGQRAGVDPA
jgi:hypothetical protein